MIKTTLLAILALATSCAHRSGGRLADGSTKWSETTFGTDYDRGTMTADGFDVYGQNQSKVANQAVKTAGTLGAAAITAGMLTDINASNNGVTTTESGNALKATQAKEATKVAKDTNATSVKLLDTELKHAVP